MTTLGRAHEEMIDSAKGISRDLNETRSRSQSALRALLGLIADPPHDLDGVPDLWLAQIAAHRRGNRKEPRAQPLVADIALAG